MKKEQYTQKGRKGVYCVKQQLNLWRSLMVGLLWNIFSGEEVTNG